MSIPILSGVEIKVAENHIARLPKISLKKCYLVSDFIFDFTAAGVVPCGGRKTSPRTSAIMQFIFFILVL